MRGAAIGASVTTVGQEGSLGVSYDSVIWARATPAVHFVKILRTAYAMAGVLF